ncbi:MAG: tRNA pseudouridine(38-40) synthase TruA [Acidimicrobiia bacterium]|nr:tRNA pseudouridine(38-40) synthase TruA [Acidimicrobiia bacterium]
MTLFDEVPERAAPIGPLVRVRATVAYDGTGLSGFAAQPGQRTVAGTLQAALERVLQHPVELTVAGRTDAGVHGWGQVVSFDAAPDRFDPARLKAAVNGLCGPAIVVREVASAPPEFSARFSATSRLYRYTIVNRPDPDPFLARTAWHVPTPLHLPLLELACDPLLGEHDFSSFCRRPKGEPGASLVRRVVDARWEADPAAGPGVLRFWIEATAFCHQMVRSIVGTLVDVGLQKRTAADVGAALRARNRAAAGLVAPPHGLCLWEVRFEPED